MNNIIAYFDCFAGISGDMCLGALVDAGADIYVIKEELKKIPIRGYSLTHRKVLRAGISATKVDVIIDSREAEGRRWRDIEEIIDTSLLSEEIKQKGKHIFRRLFEGEAIIHGEPFENIHLHELGGIDCIVDIFGTLIGLDGLEVKEIYASPINLGSGLVKTSHGVLPVPAPATIELLIGHPVYLSDMPFELTTPTGAAIISSFGSALASIPIMRVKRIGYGAGNKDIATMPNTLRLLIGEETLGATETPSRDFVTIIETNIDDMNPQIYEDVIDKLFSAGAMDVFLENIIMKKGRPAIKLTTIAGEHDVGVLVEILFKETTTIGLRFYRAQRKTMEREVKEVKTKYGDVRVKISRIGDKITNLSPEYEDLRAVSRKTKLPIKKIAEEVLRVGVI